MPFQWCISDWQPRPESISDNTVIRVFDDGQGTDFCPDGKIRVETPFVDLVLADGTVTYRTKVCYQVEDRFFQSEEALAEYLGQFFNPKEVSEYIDTLGWVTS